MVLKFGKGGISTGSTLRLTNTAHIRRNASTSCIYMHEIEDKTVDVKVAKFLESASVFYSLNKKGRWKLPEIIEEKIQSELPSADVKVTLMKLHKLHRKNNCIGYFTNKGSVKSVVPKKTKYVNRLSVVNVNRKPFRNRRRRRNREVEPDRNIADDNEIKYHIVYPTPSSSAVTHTNPQKIGHDVMLNTHNLGKTAVRSKCRKWRCIERDVRCDMDYTDYDAVDEDSGFDTIEEVHQSQKRSSFSEYFESALGRPSDIRIKTRRRPVKKLRKLRNKPMLHYLETQVMEVEEENSEFVYSRPPTTECQPVDVLISNQESNPDHLKTKYGDKVTFAQCEPRTFIIDITNEVGSCLKSSKAFKKVIFKKLELATFLVFSLKSTVDPDYSLWEVQVNLPTKLTSIRISALIDNIRKLDVDDVISLTTRYLETIPDECFYRKALLPITKTPFEKLNTIDTFAQLRASNCLLDDLAQPATGVLSDSNQNDALSEWIQSLKEDSVCNICYTDVSPFTSLRPCGHIFCNECWKEHLLSSFTFKSKVVCPEYKCDQEVDVGTMLRLVNIRDIQRSEKKNMNTKVESSSCMKWCPNQKCERILQNYDLKQDCVILCDCGMFVCFECNDERHWPASCDEYASYKNKLNAFGGDVLRSDFLDIPRLKVRGKPCPGCKAFIIKNRGCPNMICPCGCRFCWSCLTPLRNHTYSNCGQKNEQEGAMVHEFVHIDKKVVGNPMKSKLYSRAVAFRKMRREKHIKDLWSKTLGLKVRISKWLAKHDVSFGDFGLLSEQQFDELFSDVFNVTMELNYLSEICLVILDSKAKIRNRVLPNLRCSFECLEFYGRMLNDILMDSDLKNIKSPKKLLTELISLRQTAKGFIASTVHVIKHFRNYESKR